MTLAGAPGEATHWTGRAMAKAAGISLRSVQRIWTAHGLQPHRVRTLREPELAGHPDKLIEHLAGFLPLGRRELVRGEQLAAGG
jgi:hypothetical protein